MKLSDNGWRRIRYPFIPVYSIDDATLLKTEFDEKFVKEDTNDYDIIIIGAGLAGLTCAYTILNKVGLDILIIEANDEAGGRILSKKFCTSYHANSSQKHVTNLLNTLHIKIMERTHKERKDRILYARGKPLKILPKFYGAEVHNFFQRIEENSSNIRFSNYFKTEEAENLAVTSVEQLLRQIVYFPYVRSLCRAYICTTCAMRNLNDISALWFFVMLYGASGFSNRLRIMIGDNNQYFVQGGMSKITHTLLKHILQEEGEIKYVEPVSKIMFNDVRAYVFTEKDYFRCQLAVIAIPPSMMDNITIEPIMYTKALYAPAENVFFNVTYKKPFWPDKTSIKDIVTTWDFDNNLNLVHDTSHEHSNKIVLTGFLAESHFTQTRKKCLFTTLNDCYNASNASNYLQYKEYDPSLANDGMTFGCPMSTLRPTSFDDHLHKEVSYERILFTSSEYAKNWPGTIDGAIQAGERTAFEVLLRIRPQVLSFRDMTTLGEMINMKTITRHRTYSWKLYTVQYLGIILHVAIFLSFLRVAYD